MTWVFSLVFFGFYEVFAGHLVSYAGASSFLERNMFLKMFERIFLENNEIIQVDMFWTSFRSSIFLTLICLFVFDFLQFSDFLKGFLGGYSRILTIRTAQ